MKRKDLIRTILDQDAEFVREGGGHTVYRNPITGAAIVVPRHTEISEGLARTLVKIAKQR